MAWPYRISFDQTDAQKHERRVLLDRYGVYAQLSALIPIAIYQLYRLAIWVSLARRRSQVKYSAVPGSPDLKHGRGSKSGVLERKWREVRWWAEGEIWPGLGLKGQWVAGLIWAGWLGFLCVHRTGVGMFLMFIFLSTCLYGFFGTQWSLRDQHGVFYTIS